MYERRFGSFFCAHVTRKKLPKRRLFKKTRAFNIDEIDGRCQFHQRFYIQIFHTNVVLAAFSSYILDLAKNSYKKLVHLTLMKLKVGGKERVTDNVRKGKKRERWREMEREGVRQCEKG